MGIFGGGNSTTSKTEIQNTDNRVAASDQAIVAAKGATINFQDPGIVSVLGNLEKDAFKVVTDATLKNSQTVSQALDLAKSRSGSAANRIADFIGPGLIVIGLLGGLYIWKNA